MGRRRSTATTSSKTTRGKSETDDTSTAVAASHVHLFVFITDGGANEVLARKLWQLESKDCPQVIVISTDCLEHASHLITLGSLKKADKLLQWCYGGGTEKPKQRTWKYFSFLATTSITFRDLSKDLFKEWCNVHGAQSAVKQAKTLWPKCQAGRWNSCSDVESRMRASGGQDMVEPVIASILGSGSGAARKDAGAGHAGTPATVEVDEISIEECAFYSKQMGKWRETAQACVADPLWWVEAEAMRIDCRFGDTMHTRQLAAT